MCRFDEKALHHALHRGHGQKLVPERVKAEKNKGLMLFGIFEIALKTDERGEDRDGENRARHELIGLLTVTLGRAQLDEPANRERHDDADDRVKKVSSP